MSKNLPLPFKSVKNKRALVSLDNVVSFISECTTNEKSKNELYLLADQEHPSTEEMITAFSTGMGMTARIVYFPRVLLKIFLSAMRKKVYMTNCMAIWKSTQRNQGNSFNGLHPLRCRKRW